MINDDDDIQDYVASSGWRKRQIALDIKAENARKLGLDYELAPQEQNEFVLRGKLAALLCWHRLTQAEQEDLLRFAVDFKAAMKDAAQQEPVAWMDRDGNFSDNNDHKCFPIALYTTPNIKSYSEKDGKRA